MSPKLRGYRSYEGYAGLLLKIFPLVPKVTRLRKLRCFLEIFKFVLPKVTRFQKLRRFRRAFVEDFPSCPKSYEVTRLRPKLLSNPSTYLATTASWHGSGSTKHCIRRFFLKLFSSPVLGILVFKSLIAVQFQGLLYIK